MENHLVFDKSETVTFEEGIPINGFVSDLNKQESKSVVRKKWTPTEIELLKQNFSFMSNEEIQIHLPNRSLWAIYRMAYNLGLQRDEFFVHNKSKIRLWSDEEIELVKKYYPSELTNEQIVALVPGRSYMAIKTLAKNLKLRRGKILPDKKQTNSRRWSKQEIEIVKEHYCSKNDSELLRLLPGRSRLSVKHIVRKLGMLPKCQKLSISSKSTEWTETEKYILSVSFPIMPNQELQGLLPGRSMFAIKTMARKLGIKRAKNVWATAGKYSPWKEDELDILRNNLNKVELSELIKMLPERTASAILKKLQLLKLI